MTSRRLPLPHSTAFGLVATLLLAASAGTVAAQEVATTEIAVNRGGYARVDNPPCGDDSACGVLAVQLPAGAQYVGYSLEARESWGDWRECVAGVNCLEGWSRFAEEPVLVDTPRGPVVTTVFKNWCHDRVRHARLTVYYETWTAPSVTVPTFPGPALTCVTPRGWCPLVAGFHIPRGATCTCVFPGPWGPLAVPGRGW